MKSFGDMVSSRLGVICGKVIRSDRHGQCPIKVYVVLISSFIDIYITDKCMYNIVRYIYI